MTSRDFCYWLQGFFELAEPGNLTSDHIRVIKQHLSLVFTHEIDPSFPKAQQSVLNALHSGNDEKRPRC